MLKRIMNAKLGKMNIAIMKIALIATKMPKRVSVMVISIRILRIKKIVVTSKIVMKMLKSYWLKVI